MKTLLKTLPLLFSSFFFSQTWNITGNSGTNPTINFIGTIDNQSFVIKTNNSEKLRVTPKGRLLINGLDDTHGWNNNFFVGGGNENLSGIGNYAFGIGSMNSITGGKYNHAFGFNTLQNLKTGEHNIAIGGNSLMNNLTGSSNIGVGGGTLSLLSSGNNNTAVGAQAINGGSGFSITGSNNTAIGSASLRGLRNDSSNNTALGAQAFINLRTDSNNNVAIGYNTSSIELFNANNNIYIGANVQPSNSSPANELNIGNWIYGKNGSIGIGTTKVSCINCAGYKLFVKDGIRTEKVKVDIASINEWADFVFEKDYKLIPLSEIRNFIATNKHLPNVPTAQEVVENGIELKEMNVLLLRKIEELTLYLIQQEERISELEKNQK